MPEGPAISTTMPAARACAAASPGSVSGDASSCASPPAPSCGRRLSSSSSASWACASMWPSVSRCSPSASRLSRCSSWPRGAARVPGASRPWSLAAGTLAAPRGPEEQRDRLDAEGEQRDTDGHIEAHAHDADDEDESRRPQEGAGGDAHEEASPETEPGEAAAHARAAGIVVEIAGPSGMEHGGQLAAVARVQTAVQRQAAALPL